MQIQASHLGLRKVVSIKMLMTEPTCHSKFWAHRRPLPPSFLHPLTLLLLLGFPGAFRTRGSGFWVFGQSLEEAHARSSSPSQKQLERG